MISFVERSRRWQEKRVEREMICLVADCGQGAAVWSIEKSIHQVLKEIENELT